MSLNILSLPTLEKNESLNKDKFLTVSSLALIGTVVPHSFCIVLFIFLFHFHFDITISLVETIVPSIVALAKDEFSTIYRMLEIVERCDRRRERKIHYVLGFSSSSRMTTVIDGTGQNF